jgi:hypothetical protein
LVQALDGPLYLDGALVPLGPAARTTLSSDRSVNSPWDHLTEFAVTAFATAVAAHLENGHPVFAISKTQETSALVETLATIARTQTGTDWLQPSAAAESPLPWQTDQQFVSHLLGDHVDDRNHSRTWAYTPWLSQPEISVPKRDARKRPVTEEQLAHFSPSQLERTYFFVRIPGSEGIFRVETPRSLLDELSVPERESVQQRVLRAMAAQRGTAEPIGRADERAALSYEARNELRSIINRVTDIGTEARAVPEHNRDLRWRH